MRPFLYTSVSSPPVGVAAARLFGFSFELLLFSFEPLLFSLDPRFGLSFDPFLGFFPFSFETRFAFFSF